MRLFRKNEKKAVEIEEEDLIEFEINLRLEELADLEFAQKPEMVLQLGEHIARLQKVLNDKRQIAIQEKAEEHKARTFSPDLVGKAVLTAVSMGALFLLQRGGVIDRGMDKFIPKP